MTNKLYLIRHAQSEANVDTSILQTKTNVGVSLTNTGFQQAHETGKFLADLLKDETTPIVLWRSPYLRTRQTAEIISTHLHYQALDHQVKESIHLTERQFGLVDNVINYHSHFAHESEHYDLHKQFDHDFFARPPLGESPFDMCLRLDFFLKSVLSKEQQINIIVTHGAAIRGLKIMHLNHPFEEYTKPNAKNASIELIDHEKSHGVIFSPSIKTT